MIGRFGEVVLMDWGVAKSVAGDSSDRGDRGDGGIVLHGPTRQDEIIGTPAYMSPEQASGDVNAVDHRSDLYSATVLFHELLAVQHYLSSCKNMQQVMMAILSEQFRYMRLVFVHHPKHPVPPAELLHIVVRGLAKVSAARYQSAEEMIGELSRIRDGRCRVSCPATLAKRMLDTGGRFVNRYPKLSPFVFYSVLLFLISYVAISAHLLINRGT